MVNRLAFCILCLVAMPSFAQQTEKTPSWLPKTFPGAFDFANLSISKISADGKTMQIARPKIQAETRTRTIAKTVFRKETRERTVSEGGEEKTVTYDVTVPMTVMEEQAYIVRFPSGSDRFEVAMDQVSALDLSGNPIDRNALASRLQKPAYVLAMEGNAKSFTAIDPFYLNVLRADTLVIFLPPGSIPAAPVPAAPVPAAPVPAAPVPAAPIPAAPIPEPRA
jgi:hypothetical protein